MDLPGAQGPQGHGGQPLVRGDLLAVQGPGLAQGGQVVGGAAGPDEGVAAPEVEAEPGGGQVGLHDVEPHGDLGQLHGGGVEVHAVDPVQGDPRLDAAPLGGQPVGVDRLPELLLPALQVGLGELVDGLVGEGP